MKSTSNVLRSSSVVTTVLVLTRSPISTSVIPILPENGALTSRRDNSTLADSTRILASSTVAAAVSMVLGGMFASVALSDRYRLRVRSASANSTSACCSARRSSRSSSLSNVSPSATKESGAKRAKVTVPLLSGNRVTLCLARAVPTDLMFSRNSLKTMGAVTTGSSRAPPQPPLGRPLDADSSVSPPHAVSVAMLKTSAGVRVKCRKVCFIGRV